MKQITIVLAFIIWVAILMGTMKANKFELTIAILILGIVIATLPLWVSLSVVAVFIAGYLFARRSGG